jgi:hypothetical protein
VSQVPLDQQAFHIRDILDALKHYFGHSWGPRMEWYLTNALLAHVSIQNATLLGVKLMLENNAYRQWVAKNCTNPQAQDFWRYEFPNQRQAFQQEAVAPIQNKLGPLLAMPHTQNMFGQVGSTVDFRWAMDHKRIIFIRLAKGAIGEDNANLLGSIFISLLVKAGLSRADQESEDRVPFSMFIDEAHSFTTASLKTAYSELRKYGWNLISASQRFGKFEDTIRDDILSNAGTAIAFNVGPDDADLLAHHFPRDDDGKPWESYMFRELENYTCAVADRFGGSHVYQTLPALTGPFHHGLRHQALQETRERYQRPRAIIEKKISRWRDYWRQAEEEVRAKRRPPKRPKKGESQE